jgi:hypothetical protein
MLPLASEVAGVPTTAEMPPGRVYVADPANSLTLPVFLWTALGLLLWVCFLPH